MDPVVHPLLSTGAVAVPQLDIIAIGSIAAAQVQAFSGIQFRSDRAIFRIKVPLLRVGADLIVRLNVRTVVGPVGIGGYAQKDIVDGSDTYDWRFIDQFQRSISVFGAGGGAPLYR